MHMFIFDIEIYCRVAAGTFSASAKCLSARRRADPMEAVAFASSNDALFTTIVFAGACRLAMYKLISHGYVAASFQNRERARNAKMEMSSPMADRCS